MFGEVIGLNVAGFQQKDFDDYVQNINTVIQFCNFGEKLDKKLTTDLGKIIRQSTNLFNFYKTNGHDCLSSNVRTTLLKIFQKICCSPKNKPFLKKLQADCFYRPQISELVAKISELYSELVSEKGTDPGVTKEFVFYDIFDGNLGSGERLLLQSSYDYVDENMDGEQKEDDQNGNERSDETEL